MIDINELRTVIKEICWPTSPLTVDELIELLDRLEAAEKEREALRAEVQTWQDQAKAYWSKITEMEQQEPIGGMLEISPHNYELRWYRPVPFGAKLYTLPGAQPAPSVPEDVMRDAERYRWLRNDALNWYVGPEYGTYNDVVCSGECCNLAGTGAELDATIDAMLAPEAKP